MDANSNVVSSATTTNANYQDIHTTYVYVHSQISNVAEETKDNETSNKEQFKNKRIMHRLLDNMRI